MMTNQYPMLATLVQAYFHQDFDEEEDSAGFGEFARTHSISERTQFVADVRAFVAENPENLLDCFERTFQPDLVLADDDEGLREWLAHAMVTIAPSQA